MSYSIAELNQLSQDAFIAAVGNVFEHTPSIAAQAWSQRPFKDVTDLHQTMVAVMHGLTLADQLALIGAHPDLGSRLKMAEASVKEQAGVGLDRLSPQDYARFQQLNQAYRDKFGFPFIIAVRNHTRESILTAFEQRLLNSQEVELQQALAEITAITRFRLLDLVHADH